LALLTKDTGLMILNDQAVRSGFPIAPRNQKISTSRNSSKTREEPQAHSCPAN